MFSSLSNVACSLDIVSKPELMTLSFPKSTFHRCFVQYNDATALYSNEYNILSRIFCQN